MGSKIKVGDDLNIDDEDDFTISLSSKKRVEEAKFYAGMLTASLGLESQLKENLFLQTNLFYRYGLQPMGREESDVSMIGLKSTLKFKVK